MVKLTDISKATGFNVSTVSRALNNRSDINLETRQVIQEAAQSLGYKQKHRTSEANSMGIVLPEVDSSYYAHLLHTLEERIRGRGFYTVLTLTGFVWENTLNAIKLLALQGVKGIFCAHSLVHDDAEILKKLSALSVPIVFATEGNSSPFFDYIETDNYCAVEQALDHLIGLGHTDIGYIGEELSDLRRRMFESVLTKRGMKVNQSFIKVGATRFEQGGFEQMNALLDQAEHPTAVLASYDHIAIGAMRAARLRSLCIPQDISIVGIDDINMSPYLNPPLTTISHPVNEMGAIAAKILFDKIENPENKLIQHVYLQPTLVVRETTAPPAAK